MLNDNDTSGLRARLTAKALEKQGFTPDFPERPAPFTMAEYRPIKMVYNVIGKYGHREAELLDSFDDMETAQDMAAEYRMAYGQGWSIYIAPNEENEHES